MKHRTRRKRRQAKQGIKHGRAAFPRHTSKGGRTGTVHAKKPRSKQVAALPPCPIRSVVDSVRCVKCGARPGEMHRH